MGLPAVQETQNENTGFEISLEFKDLGDPNSLRYSILTSVLAGKYDFAIQELKNFIEADSVYPNFHERIHRFVNHSTDLIFAIKTKRNFPGMNSLTRAKQQELFEKFKHHFYELQYMLKKIEKIQKDLKMEDVRSTIYVVRTTWYAIAAITVLAVILEFFGGLAQTLWVVVDDFTTDLIVWLFSRL